MLASILQWKRQSGPQGIFLLVFLKHLSMELLSIQTYVFTATYILHFTHDAFQTMRQSTNADLTGS